jgi:hypothetical protein
MNVAIFKLLSQICKWNSIENPREILELGRGESETYAMFAVTQLLGVVTF